jgi:hypothetical protein
MIAAKLAGLDITGPAPPTLPALEPPGLGNLSPHRAGHFACPASLIGSPGGLRAAGAGHQFSLSWRTPMPKARRA